MRANLWAAEIVNEIDSAIQTLITEAGYSASDIQDIVDQAIENASAE